MRPLLLAAAALIAALPAACGGGSAAPGSPPVRLAVTAPGDQAVVHADRVELSGTVRPSTATVTVLGRRAAVSGGTFRATVPLAVGTNVVDVIAEGGGGGRPALTAIRVRRQISVRVPDVTGLSLADARGRLNRLGLKPDVQQSAGILDRLLPGDAQVCDTDPTAGAAVDPGTTVLVFASRSC